MEERVNPLKEIGRGRDQTSDQLFSRHARYP